MTAITTFTGGATATNQRTRLLERLADDVDGVELAQFDYGKPCTWLVRFGDGEVHRLSRGQVESWVAGFRAGRAHALGRVADGDGEKFAAHVFA